MVLVDYYSKYFELTQLKDSTSATLINCLQQHMSRHGVPEILYSENGPEFSSLEFRQFAKAYQFQHVTSSPRFPQSNGLAERTVQTSKKLLKKAYEDKKDPYLAILELRTTPIPGVGLLPTQLLMGRRIRSIIPIKSTLLTPMTYNTKEVQSALENHSLVLLILNGNLWDDGERRGLYLNSFSIKIFAHSHASICCCVHAADERSMMFLTASLD